MTESLTNIPITLCSLTSKCLNKNTCASCQRVAYGWAAGIMKPLTWPFIGHLASKQTCSFKRNPGSCVAVWMNVMYGHSGDRKLVAGEAGAGWYTLTGRMLADWLPRDLCWQHQVNLRLGSREGDEVAWDFLCSVRDAGCCEGVDFTQ